MATTAGGVRGTADTMVDSTVGPMDGWVLFASLLILGSGFWNVFEGVFAFFRASYFIGSPVFGSLWIWALAWTIFGVVEIAAAGAIMAGQSWGRWFGIVVVGLNALLHMLAIAAYPWWSVLIVAIDVLILYALTARWRSSAVA